MPTAERPLRVAEFDELFATAVREVRREDQVRLVLDLSPRPEVAAKGKAAIEGAAAEGAKAASVAGEAKAGEKKEAAAAPKAEKKEPEKKK